MHINKLPMKKHLAHNQHLVYVHCCGYYLCLSLVGQGLSDLDIWQYTMAMALYLEV